MAGTWAILDQNGKVVGTPTDFPPSFSALGRLQRVSYKEVVIDYRDKLPQQVIYTKEQFGASGKATFERPGGGYPHWRIEIDGPTSGAVRQVYSLLLEAAGLSGG